jgi:hypothetical protein
MAVWLGLCLVVSGSICGRWAAGALNCGLPSGIGCRKVDVRGVVIGV